MDTSQHLTATAGRRLMPAGEFKRVMGGISEMTRWRHEKAGIGPRPIKLNGRNYYLQDEVLAYLDQLAASRPCDGSAGGGEVEGGLAERTAATSMSEGAKGD